MNMLPSPRRVTAWVLLSALGACSLLPRTPEPPPAPAPVAMPAPAPPPPVCPEPPAPVADAGELPALLAYHQELRALSAAELSRELVTLNSQPRTPAQAIRKAMLLGQGRTSAELALAQQQLDGAAPAPESLRPLVALLGSRFAEQRRLLDALDRQGQQLRDSQRRNEQLNDKLEALKAIEQRLPASPAAPAAPPPGASASARQP